MDMGAMSCHLYTPVMADTYRITGAQQAGQVVHPRSGLTVNLTPAD